MNCEVIILKVNVKLKQLYLSVFPYLCIYANVDVLTTLHHYYRGFCEIFSGFVVEFVRVHWIQCW